MAAIISNSTYDDDTDDTVSLDQGFCEDLFGHISILKSEWEIFAVFEFIVFIIMIIWIQYLQDISSEVMYMIRESKIIFPIHKKLLIAFALLSLFQSIIVIVFTHFQKITGGVSRSYTVEYIFAWMFGLSAGLDALVSEGSALLFLSAGIGQRSMMRTFKIVSIWGLATTFTFFIYFLSIFSSNPKFQTNSFLSFGESLQTIWESLQFIFYTTIYFVTISSGNKYRPAAMVWSRYWAFYRFLLLLSFGLMSYHVSFGNCLYSLSTLLFFILLKLWIAFKCYRLEARWWHGDDEFTDADIQCLVSFYTTIFNCLGCRSDKKTQPVSSRNLSSSINRGSTALHDPLLTPPRSSSSRRVPSGEMDAAERERLRSKTLATASPLAGLQLSGNSALLVAAEVDKSTRLSSHFGSSHSSGSSSAKRRVPLIDFNKIQILPNKLIGQGSSAKVYEGRWGSNKFKGNKRCFKKCAVKVLYSVEITSEEILRTCKEAQLLHSLTSSTVQSSGSSSAPAGVSSSISSSFLSASVRSEYKAMNVVGLYGIAVIPPSLCVILELCSEGSLQRVLHELKEDSITPASTTSSFLGLKTPEASMTEREASHHQSSASSVYHHHQGRAISASSQASASSMLHSVSGKLSSIFRPSVTLSSSSHDTTPPLMLAGSGYSSGGGYHRNSAGGMDGMGVPGHLVRTSSASSLSAQNQTKASQQSRIRSFSHNTLSTVDQHRPADSSEVVLPPNPNTELIREESVSSSTSDLTNRSSPLRHPHVGSSMTSIPSDRLMSSVSQKTSMVSIHSTTSLNTMPSQYLYNLCWLEQLEIACGAVRGVYEVHTILPEEYSHNDIKSSNFLVQKKRRRNAIFNTAHHNAGHVDADDSDYEYDSDYEEDFNTCGDCCCNTSKFSASFSQHTTSTRRGASASSAVSDSDTSSFPFYLYNSSRESLKFKYEVKIADIEFASQHITPPHMMFGAHKFVTNEVVNWTAPEILSGEGSVSQQSDVFALSMVLYEVYNRNIPFENEMFTTVADLYLKGKRPLFQHDDVWKLNILEKQRKPQLHHVYSESGNVYSTNSSPSQHSVISIDSATMITDLNMSGEDEPKRRNHKQMDGEELIDRLIAIELQSRERFKDLINQGWQQLPSERITCKQMLAEIESIYNDYIYETKMLNR